MTITAYDILTINTMNKKAKKIKEETGVMLEASKRRVR